MTRQTPTKAYQILTSTRNMSREEWLKVRRQGIGGSDAAAIMGVSPYSSAYAVWADKLGQSAPKAQTEAMRQGTDLEWYVAKRFLEGTKLRVERRNAVYQSKPWPYMLANIDRWVPAARCGLECKTTGAINLKRFANGEYPIEYYTQCVHYMAVTGAQRWFLCVLVYQQPPMIFEIRRDEADIAALVRAECEFWNEHVLTGIAPATDGSDSTKDTLSGMYPADDGETLRANDEAGLARVYELKQIAKATDDELQAVINALKSEMGSAKTLLGQEYTATWRTQADNHFDKTALSKAHPEIDMDEYTKHGTKRVFSVKKESEQHA